VTRITVCMATRNGETYVKRQLESILSQMHEDDELVISDDSSTDGTLDIIKSFVDNRIRLYENNTFFSPIFNFENALKKATGKILVLSDQDDVWLENKMTVIEEAFKNSPNPVYLIALDGYVVDEYENIIEESIFRKVGAGSGILKNIYDNSYVGCCLAFSRELLEVALPFPKNIPMHDMWLGLLGEILGRVDFIPEKTIRYRKHSGSMTEFKRRFIPIIQIKRRWFLSYYLAQRWFKVRFSGK
jgi:GT2 family glycosyltransferase